MASDESAADGDRAGDDKICRDCQFHDRGADGPVRLVADNQSAVAEEQAEDAPPQHDHRHAFREMGGRRGGNDQQDENKHDADDLREKHDGQRDEQMQRERDGGGRYAAQIERLLIEAQRKETVAEKNDGNSDNDSHNRHDGKIFRRNQ